MFNKFRPAGDRLLVKRAPVEEKTASGIIIPDSAREKERAQEGEVIAVGTGRKDQSGKYIPVEIAVGAHIYFGKYAGTEAGKDATGAEYIIIKEDEVLGIIER
ncbi:MAG TPA: co-chaperone GroES [Candidatus Babeliales bacterium]|jgi:chaperonin GroES|nr:co-chaperone GroES [Candidatus Babeliales bacterium]